MIQQLTTTSRLRSSQIGGKAHGLQKLQRAGMTVPPVAVILAKDAQIIKSMSDIEIQKELLKLPFIKSGHEFAVRSSGIGEDGVENSYAGMFDTFLNVKQSDIPKAIRQVYGSLESTHSKQYSQERDTAIISMAVVIQQMINADFAGVAFSVDPIEIDNRIALIEIVEGIGESLVSGKQTPSSIRLNKLTGQTRVIRYGNDAINDILLKKIADQVSDLLIEIERYYKMPIDVEWAIKDGVVYLLQARPITTLLKDIRNEK